MKRLTDKQRSKLWEVARQHKQMADVLSEIWWRAVKEGEPAKAKRYRAEMNDALNDAQEWAELAAESTPTGERENLKNK